jgi:hypothetical protein
MAQKKTVFERLEETMIELQRNIETRLAKLQTSIENVKEEIPKAIGTLREEIPRSIGQNLMSFTDVIGAKIEEIEDAVKKIGGTAGQPMDSSSSLNVIQNELNGIKTSILNLQATIKNIKIETPITTAPPPMPTPSATPTLAHTLSPIPATTSHTPLTTPPPASTPPLITTPKPTPPLASPSKPASTVGPPMTDVFKLLDSIKEKAKSRITAIVLANEMEQTRDAIVKIFRWHPALYELATFARRLKKYPEGAPLDNETRALLLEKVEEWKNRINT